MLVVLPALILTCVPTGDVARQTLTAEELARCAGKALVEGQFALAAGEFAQVEVDAPIAFRDAGVWWHGELGQAWLQFADAGDVVTEPELIVLDEHLSETTGGPAGDARVSALAHSYGQPNVRTLLTFFGPVQLTDLTLMWLAPADISRDAAGLTLDASAGYPKPPVYARSSWGAAPPKCTYSYCNTTHMGVHHTASASAFNSTSWSQCASNVKGVQSYHQNTKGWCDIGYNYLICVHGDIFEGRGGGDNVKAAHDSKNCGSMGVSLMGYFHAPHNQVPSVAMVDALEELGAWKADQQGIDPLGTSFYAGLGANMTNVYGHRDVGTTACPGDKAYAMLPALRADIQGKLDVSDDELLMDNDVASYYGNTWFTGSSAATKLGSDYRYNSTGYDNDQALWFPDVPAAGMWTVQLWWSHGSNRNPYTYYAVQTNGQTHWAAGNQQSSGGQWNTMGTYYFAKGAQGLVGVFGYGAPGKVTIADGIRLVKN